MSLELVKELLISIRLKKLARNSEINIDKVLSKIRSIFIFKREKIICSSKQMLY